MKIRLILLLSVSISIDNCISQSNDYGLILIYNSSAQTNYDPTIPEDGTFQWNSLGTWGGGLYLNCSLSTKFGTKASLSYQQKGYIEIAQVGYIPGGPVNEERLKNTFNYLCADLAIKYDLFHSKTLSGQLGLGLEYGYLLDYTIQSDFFPINNFYPVNEYQDRWNEHNLSVIPSISICFDEATAIEFGLNGSLTPVLKTENLIVRDWIWTFRVNQSIPQLFSPRRK